MPLGASEGYSAVTGMTWDKSEMTCQWDAAFMRADQMTALNLALTRSPEGLLEAFTTLQRRGRECLVELGPFTRRGILRRLSPKPGRGYSVDVTTGRPSVFGVNLEVTLSWEWTGSGAAQPNINAPPSGKDLAGKLSGASAKLGLALADSDPFAPNFLESLRGGIGRLRGGIAKLRKSLTAVGNLARAPAQIANEAARGGGGAWATSSTTCRTCSATPATITRPWATLPARRVGRVERRPPGATVARGAAAKRSTAQAQGGVNDVADVLAAMFRRARGPQAQAGQRAPRQSLSEIATTQLGRPTAGPSSPRRTRSRARWCRRASTSSRSRHGGAEPCPPRRVVCSLTMTVELFDELDGPEVRLASESLALTAARAAAAAPTTDPAPLNPDAGTWADEGPPGARNRPFFVLRGVTPKAWSFVFNTFRRADERRVHHPA